MPELELPDSLKIMIEDICNKQSIMGNEDAFKASQSVDLTFLSELCRVPVKYRTTTFEATPNRLTEVAKDFAINGKGVMVVCGGNGTGKTNLGCCCINERILNELPGGLFISCDYEVGPLVRSHRNFNSKKSEYDFMNEFYTAPFCFIDEACKGDDLVISKMFLQDVLKARYNNDLPTFIAMNGTKDEFLEFVEKDVANRLREIGRIYVLNEKDWRTQ